MTDLKACKEMYLIRQIKMEERTAGGIFLTSQTRKEPMQYGVVLDKGPGTPADPKVGDVVFFTAGTEEVMDFEADGRPGEVFLACPIECLLAWKRVTKKQLEGMLTPVAVAFTPEERKARTGKALAR